MLWNVEAKAVAKKIKPIQTRYQEIEFSPCGRFLLVGGRDFSAQSKGLNKLVVLATKDFKKDKSFAGTSAKGDISFSPDQKSVAVCRGQAITVYEVGSWRQKFTAYGHGDYVKSVRWSPDGSRLVSNGLSTIRIWDAQTGLELRVARLKATDILYVSEDSIIFSNSNRIGVWSPEREPSAWPLRSSSPLSDVTFARNDQVVLAKNRGGLKIGWEVPSGKRVSVSGLDWPDVPRTISKDGRWQVVKFSMPESSTLGVSATLIDKRHPFKPPAAFQNPNGVTDLERLAIQGERLENWYVATFHWALYLRLNPSNPVAFDSFRNAYNRWTHELPRQQLSSKQKRSHSIIADSLKVERGNQSPKIWQSLHGRLSKAVLIKKPDRLSKVIDHDVILLRELCSQHPTARHLSTLGAAEFRIGKFAESITTLQRSIKLHLAGEEMLRLGDLAPDYAFLAMAQMKSGNRQGAIESRKEFLRLFEVSHFQARERNAHLVDEVAEAFEK